MSVTTTEKPLANKLLRMEYHLVNGGNTQLARFELTVGVIYKFGMASSHVRSSRGSVLGEPG